MVGERVGHRERPSDLVRDERLVGSLRRPLLVTAGLTLPSLTASDPDVLQEGSLDPLGMGRLAGLLADELAPEVTARMSRIRFVTTTAVARTSWSCPRSGRRRTGHRPFSPSSGSSWRPSRGRTGHRTSSASQGSRRPGVHIARAGTSARGTATSPSPRSSASTASTSGSRSTSGSWTTGSSCCRAAARSSSRRGGRTRAVRADGGFHADLRRVRARLLLRGKQARLRRQRGRPRLVRGGRARRGTRDARFHEEASLSLNRARGARRLPRK